MNTFIANKYNVFIALEEAYGEFVETSSDFYQIRPESEGFEHQGKTEVLKRSYISKNLGNSKSLAGAPSCSLKMKLPVRGGGTEMASGNAASLCNELSIPLTSSIGNVNYDIATSVDTGSTTGDIAVTQSTPSDYFSYGGLVFLKETADGEVHGRWISDIDDTSQTISVADWDESTNWLFDSAPVSGDMLYGCVNFTPYAELNNSCCIEISGITIGGEQPVWRYNGLVGNLSIADGAAQKRIMLEFEFKGNDYESDTDAPLISTSAGATAWPVSPTDLRSLNADFRINGIKTAYQSFSFDIGNNWAEVPNANSETGREGFGLTGIATKGKAVVYWNSELPQKLKQGDTIDISWIVGNHINGVGFHAPKAELQEIKETEINGLLAMEITFAPVETGNANISDWTLAFSGKRA